MNHIFCNNVYITLSISYFMSDQNSPLEKNLDQNTTRLRFNGEETSIKEIIKQCNPVLEEYYDSIQPRPKTDQEKCLALQIELGKVWVPHADMLKSNLEIMFLTKNLSRLRQQLQKFLLASNLAPAKSLLHLAKTEHQWFRIPRFRAC